MNARGARQQTTPQVAENLALSDGEARMHVPRPPAVRRDLDHVVNAIG